MTDEHAMHHVNYLAVFIALCILTGMSVIFDVVEMRGKTILGIFNGTILLIFFGTRRGRGQGFVCDGLLHASEV